MTLHNSVSWQPYVRIHGHLLFNTTTHYPHTCFCVKIIVFRNNDWQTCGRSLTFGLCNCGTMKRHKMHLHRDHLCKSALSFSLCTSILQAAGSINTGEKKHSHLQDQCILLTNAQLSLRWHVNPHVLLYGVYGLYYLVKPVAHRKMHCLCY